MSKDTIKQGIVELLKEDARCRNDDKWLIFRFYRDVMKIKMFIPFEEFARMPSFESIRRIRAVIQNQEGKYLPTNESVRKKRWIAEKEWRIWLKQQSAMDAI